MTAAVPASHAAPDRDAADPTLARAIRARLRGPVLAPGDVGFEQARRGHNTAHDRRPAAIARPLDADDVAAAVVTGRELGLEIAVRAGGHSVAGHSVIDGGLVIDLGALRDVAIDPERRTGSAGGGVRAGEYTVAAHEFGLATPFGDTTTVGLGGLTLGGGIGWLVRKHGLTIDSLLSADLVTADGRRITVDEASDPDLFWAIRGGGGNFGIATRLRYRLHEVNVVTGGLIALPLTTRVLRDVVDVSQAAPDELTQITLVMGLPPAPFVPAELVGTPAVIILPVHAGDPAAGAAAIAPFRSIATPLIEMIGPRPYPAMYQLTAGGEQPGPSVVRSAFLAGLDTDAAAAIVERHTSPGGEAAMTQLRVLGGAMARIPADATAFAHRGAPLMALVVAGITGEPAATEAWVTSYMTDLASREIGAYANFLADEGEDRLRAAYPEATYRRLAAVKARLDPDNVFHGNHNIRPR